MTSALCRECPHPRCPGASRVDDPAACRTLIGYLDGDVGLREAAEAKRRQAARHGRTDRFRAWVQRYLRDDPRELSEERIYALSVAVSKGDSAWQARRQATTAWVPDRVCARIEAERPEP
jgi:hypothetical protein